MNESCHLANTSTILLNVCMYAHCMHFQHKIDESHKMLHHYKFISGFVVTTMHSGATHLLSWGHRKNICCKKKLVTPSVFKLQKWFFHQNKVEFNQKSSKSDMCNVWIVAGQEQEHQKLEKRCSYS